MQVATHAAIRRHAQHFPPMKTYRLVYDSHRQRTLHVGNARLPLVITGDSSIPYTSISVAMAILLDHFEGEIDAEIKARLLARPVSLYLHRLGEEWEITEYMLNDYLMLTFVEFKTIVEDAKEAYAVELISGVRRDTLRLSN